MYCTMCGREVPEAARFCKYCGFKLRPDSPPPGPLIDVHIPEEIVPEPVEVLPEKRLKPVTSLPNILFLFYFVLALLVFFKLHPSHGIITFFECIYYSLPAILLVATYNLIKGKGEPIRTISVLATIFFILLSVFGEIGRVEGGGRFAWFSKVEDSLIMRSHFLHKEKPTAVSPSEEKVMAVGAGMECPLFMPIAMKKVYLSDPAVADVALLSPTEARVSGKTKGRTTLTIWDISGNETSFLIKVE